VIKETEDLRITEPPPLPATTDISSLDDWSGCLGTGVATNLPDQTSYVVPDDGSPITIHAHSGKEGRDHRRRKSQTSLLIEYFEAGKGPNKNKSRPSVRVKLTPSSRKGEQDGVKITGIREDWKPAYSRHISLTSRRPEERGVEGTETTYSSDSNIRGTPRVDHRSTSQESRMKDDP
jgi:hypothetical protein